jgi:hypothetical protein
VEDYVKCNERNPQPVGANGSLKWLQRLVENNAMALTAAVRAASDRPPEWDIEWVSPRKNDEWAEYRDAGFLLKLGLPNLVGALQGFWPKCGPQWDGLGKATGNEAVLVEAKAHFGELTSSCGAGGDSLILVTESLNAAKNWAGASPLSDWHRPYYQYANRLAHLKFLRDHGVDATLVFVYFCGDDAMRGPSSAHEWKGQLQKAYTHLGIEPDLASRNVVNVYIPVATLEQDTA